MLVTAKATAYYSCEETARKYARKDATRTEKRGYPVFSIAVFSEQITTTSFLNQWNYESSYDGATQFTHTETRWTYEITCDDPDAEVEE